MLRSLVGSEMCIRDSVCIDIVETNCRNVQRQGFQIAGSKVAMHHQSAFGKSLEHAHTVIVEHCIGAVSYTHLTLPTIYSV